MTTQFIIFHNLPHRQYFSPITSSSPKTRPVSLSVVASKEENGSDHYGGRNADDSMGVLRVRIRELKMLLSHDKPSQKWMEWEKQYFEHYKDDVYQAMGLLQNYLSSLRPSLALGLLGLVVFSITVSSGLLLFYVVEIIKQISSTLFPLKP